MAVKLNSRAFDHAKTLIKEGKFVADDRDAWSEHQPSSEEENRYIKDHGFEEYARWHLGFDDEATEGTKGRYKFPYGDFKRLTVVACWPQSLRRQRSYYDIELAIAHLHGMLDAVA